MFLTKLRSFAYGSEATPGAGVDVSAMSNDNRVWELAIGSLEVEPDANPSKYATGDFGLGESIPGPQMASISFQTKLYSTSGAKPSWVNFVEACGCSAVASTDDYIVYPTKRALDKTLAMAIFDKEGGVTPEALHYEFVGGVGNFSVEVEGTGKPYVANFEFTLGLNDINDIDESDIPAFAASSSKIPDRFLSGIATIGSFSACISTLSFDVGNTVTPVQCQNSESGYSRFIITNQEPVITINPLLKSKSDYDFWTKWTDGTIEQIEIETDQIKLTIPRAQIVTASVEDADGLLRTTLEMRPLRPLTAGSYEYASWEMTLKAVA